MAKIGLKYPVFAVGTYVDSDGATADSTYANGFEMGHAVSANVTINHTDATLDADDTVVERDNTVTDVDITLELDDMTDAHIATVCGYTYSSSNNSVTIGGSSDSDTAYGGFGYIRKAVRAGVVSYIAYWYYKVGFSESADNATTAKSSGTEFQTMQLTGKAMKAKEGIMARFTFSTESAAMSKLNTLAGIS